MRKELLTSVAASALFALASPAMADSLTPSSFTGSVAVGGSTSITGKVGTITAGTPTAAKGDVFFVVDTTGSMGPAIGTVQAALAQTATNLAGLGTFNFGLAQYRDQANSPSDGFNYQTVSNIPETSAQVGTELGTLVASGGGDLPEQGLFALQQAATTTSWDAGFKRLAVIIGDAPAHSSGTVHNNPVAAGGATVDNTATTLNSNGVTMIALNAGPETGGPGLDQFGQFDATTGLLSKGVSGSLADFTNATDLTAAIVAAVGSAFSTYSTVSLGLVGPAPADCTVTLPSAITGSFSRATTHTFNFGSIGVTGTTAGTCTFTIGLFEDGAQIANIETDTVTVGGVGPTPTPEPASVALLGTGLLALGGILRRRSKKQR
jgi:hypothetical protein